MLLLWVVQDTVLPLVKQWRRRGWGKGLDADPERMCHLLWADDMWLLAHEVWQLELMYKELAEAMRACVGLLRGACSVPFC